MGFGNQQMHTTSAAQTVTLSNTGNAALTITGIAAIGDFAQTTTCGASLAAGANCAVTVTFTPTATGARTGAVTFTDNAAGSPHTVTLSGAGTAAPTPAASLSAASMTFGNQQINTTSAAQTVTLSNTGNAALTITGIAATGDFAQTTPSLHAPLPIANCAITLTFTPTATGPRTGAVTITDNAAGSPHTVTLSGAGTAAPTPA